MVFLEFGNDKNNADSKYHFPSLNTIASHQNRLEKHYRQHQRHAHFDGHRNVSEEQTELEVSCDHNPTQIFILLSRQLWLLALTHLKEKPLEAHIWISSRFPNSGEYKWCNLPLHLACLYGQEHPPLQFMESLIHTYPGACQCRNHEGNLPIHLACECMDLSPRFGLEAEGILATLIKAFPESLGMRDSRGRRPIDVLEERGVRALNNENVVGRGVAIMKYMRAQARIMVEKHHQRDECMNNGEGKSKRRPRPRNVDAPHTTRSGTTAHKGDKHHKKSGLKNIEVPHMTSLRSTSRDDSAAHEREKTEVRDYSKSTPTKDMGDQDTPVAEESNEAWNPALYPSHFLPRDQYNRESHNHPDELLSPVNPMIVATPQSRNAALQMVTENFDPFHQLETELTTMRMTHQSMSNQLSAKNQDVIELQERLHRLETEHTQIQKDHAQLNNKHSEKMTELEGKTKALENSAAMARVMKSKEKALSSELALLLGVQEKQDTELNQLRSELEKEQETRTAALGKLECQLEVNAELNMNIDTSKNDSEKLLSANNTLIGENKVLNETVCQSNSEKEELVNEVESLKASVVRWKTMTSKVKDSSAITNRDNSDLAKESKELRMQLASSHSEVENMCAQNMALRSVALKAIKAVSSLQQKVKHIPSSSDTSEKGLKQLLGDAKTATIGKAGHSHQYCVLNASESLELLHPIINDAQNHQHDIIESTQKLLRQSHDIMNLVGQIPSIPVEEFGFESTLQVLEDSITSNFDVLETLHAMLEANEGRQSKLTTLWNHQPPGEINNSLAPLKDIHAPGMVAISAIRDQAATMSLHYEKLESLAKTVAGLPQMKRLNLASDRKDVWKHLKMVDGITSMLQKALSKMVRDAREMKLINQNIHEKCLANK